VTGVASTVDPDVQAFAKRLRQLRTERGWSLAELSAATNFSRTFLSRLEKGQRQPSLTLLLALGRTYGVPVAELIEPGHEPRVFHRRAEVVWESNSSPVLKPAQSGKAQPFTFAARLAEHGSSTPEELMAAAQAACATMSLYNLLEARGYPPRRIRAVTDVQLEYFGGSSAAISKIDILLEAEVPGIVPGAFDRIARAVKRHSPVAKALAGAEVEIQASLLSG
jgi:lipoyl-dependent peroxiredoxin